MRVNKRRRLATQPLPNQAPLPDANAGSDVMEAAAAAVPRPPAGRTAPPPRLSINQLLQQAHMSGTMPPLTPPLVVSAPGVRELSAPATPPAAPAALDGLAQLRMQQGMSIDQWRSHALEQLDAASCPIGLHGAILEAQRSLERLADRPAWRQRRTSTLETLVDEAIGRMAELGRQPRDIGPIASLYQALQRLAPEALANRRPAFLAAVQRLSETILSAVGDDIGRLENALRCFEVLLPRLHVGFDDDAEQALRQALVRNLWYRLLEAPEALSSWSIQSWTERSETLCHRRPCPQIAALVWLRSLLSMPQLELAQCVRLTQKLREAWAVHEQPEPSGSYAQRAQTRGHLASEPDFEPAARAQLATWVAVLPHQLPTLAPFQAEPVREAFERLAQALHIHIDIEIGQPLTEGDEDIQARDLAAFVQEWEREHEQTFPGFEALFAENATWALTPTQRPSPSDMPRYEDPYGFDEWTSDFERSPTPRIATHQSQALAHDDGETLALLDAAPDTQTGAAGNQTPMGSSSSNGSVTPGRWP